MDQPPIPNETSRNFYRSKRWLILISGFGESTSRWYISYRVFLYLVLFYGLLMSLWAVPLVAPDKVQIVLAVHVSLVSVFGGVLYSSRLIAERSLKITNNMITSGIYDYENEEIDKILVNMKAQIDHEIEKTSNILLVVFSSGGFSNLAVFPLTQLIFYEDAAENHIFNPYLPPFFLYMPFGTRGLAGYCLGYLIILLLASTIYAVTLSFFIIYIHCTVQMKGHLKILNYSLRNIYKRAYSLFKKKNGLNVYSEEELFQKEEFQTCLYSCFKENVRHHQALLRFKKALQPFIGACLLDIYVMIALIYAALFYLILQNLPITFLINFMEMLLSEQSGLFLICFLGENITEESRKLFETLYSLPWIQCNKTLNKSISIMMSNTLKPLQIKALLIDNAAALTSYADFMMAMYKITNLVRQTDVV